MLLCIPAMFGGYLRKSVRQGKVNFKVTENGRSILKGGHAPETLSLLEAAADQFSDDTALLNAIAAWDERLTAVAKRFIASGDDTANREPLFDIEIASVAPEAEERVIGLLRLEERRRPIINHGSAAFALDKNAKIIVANEMARDQLSLRDGRRFDDNLVDPLFRSVMPILYAALNETHGETVSKIVRIGSGETGQTLFEARATNQARTEDPWIIFRKIGISLTIQGAQFVSEAFDLTESEIAVIRLIMDGCSTKVIAIRRATAEATVRSQLKSIFAKTGTSGQTELLRIVSGISLFQASRQSGIGAREMPSSRQEEGTKRLIRISGGHTIEIDESGDPSGKPFLSLHGLFLGYSFPSAAEGLLVSHGLRRIGLLRPGFGRSTPVDTNNSMADTVSKFIEVMDALNIEKCPVVAHGFGGAYAFALAHHHPDRVSAVINIGAYLPTDNMDSIIKLSGFQRALMFSAKHSPMLFSFFSRAAQRVFERDGMVAFLKRYLGSSQTDIAMLTDNEMESTMRMRLNLSHAQEIETYRQECLMQMSDLSAYAKHPGVPVSIIHGSEDPVFPVESIRKAAIELNADVFHEVSNCGQLMLYSHPEIAIEAIRTYV